MMRRLPVCAIALVGLVGCSGGRAAALGTDGRAYAVRRVEFVSGSDRVVGSLYVPNGASPRPGVVVEGPQTNVKEMVPAVYADRLARAGYVALTFDHRNFGESGGRVRFDENPEQKVEDVRQALAFLRTRPEVSRGAVGLLGVCSGAGYTAKAAAREPGLGAYVTIAGFYHDPAVFKSWLKDDYDARVDLGRKARLKYEATGLVDYLTNVDETNPEVAMPGHEAWEYYGTARNKAVRWENRSATMFFEHFLTFESIRAGKDVMAPTLVIHSDAALVPEGAKRFFASLPGPKKLHWMSTRQHISFYDEPPVVDEAAAAAAGWFATHLHP